MKLTETWIQFWRKWPDRLRSHRLNTDLIGARAFEPIRRRLAAAWAWLLGRRLAPARAWVRARTPGPAVLKRFVLPGLLGTGIAFAGLNLHQPLMTGPEYKTEKAKRHTLVRTITAAGPLAPILKAEVDSPIAGTTREVLAEFGSKVRAGQPLARLDSAAARLTLKDARINLKTARAAVDLAQRRAEQYKTLQGEGLMPKTDYEKAVSELQQALGAAQIAATAVTRAANEVDLCTIRSPLKGVVLSRAVSVGQAVDADSASQPLFVIASDLSRMQIEANVAESDIGAVRPGMDTTFTVDAFPDETFQGTVTQIRAIPLVDQTVVAYPVIVETKNDDLRLKPGMTASVSIEIEKREDTLAIPTKALRFRPAGGGKEDGRHAEGDKQKDSAEGTVYRLVSSGGGPDDEGRGTLEKVSITTGLSDGRRTEVLGGLNEGDRLVVGLKSRKDDEGGLLARIPAILGGTPQKKAGK